MKKISYSAKQIEEKFSFKEGFSTGVWEAQNFDAPSKFYILVWKLAGTYPNFEREPKYKGIIKEQYTRFLANKSRTRYTEVPL